MKADGHRDHRRAADREDPVELGEAEVVADRHAEGDAVEPARQRRGDDLGAGLLVLGLAVGDAADVDVEHMDLAVGGLDLPVGADQDRGVEGPLLALDPLGDAAGEQVDAELARPGARRIERRPVERLGPVAQRRRVAEQVPLLGQHDQLGAVGGGRADQALGHLEVAGLVARSS